MKKIRIGVSILLLAGIIAGCGNTKQDTKLQKEATEVIEKVETETNIPTMDTEETVSETDVYKEFIEKRAYEQYTENWEKQAEEYSLIDMNNDGILELLIRAQAEMEEWYNTLIFTYDMTQKQIILLQDIYSYAGIYYNVDNNLIYYFSERPTVMYSEYEFYKLEDNKMQYTFSIGNEMDENGEYYYQSDENDKQKISEAAYNQYMENTILPEYLPLSQDDEEAEKIELTDYLSDSNLSRIVQDIAEISIVSKEGYKECAEGGNLMIGILADAPSEYDPETINEYTQITDIINSGNANVSFYGIEIGDGYDTVKEKLEAKYQGMSIEKQENGKYDFYLGDAAILYATFSNDRLVKYEYQLRYT